MDELNEILNGVNAGQVVTMRVNGWPQKHAHAPIIARSYHDVHFVKWKSGNGMSIVTNGIEFSFPEEKLKQILEFINKN
jgi:hypothetical protein